MDVYIARQPIFNSHLRLFAYELLYRGTKETTLTSVTGERATTTLLSSAFLTEGIDAISGSRPCFVNFTADLLIKGIPLSFPKQKIVVEILEDVRPTKEVIKACKFIASQGYTLALDDFVYDKSLDPLIELAEIIKIDFRLTPLDAILKMLYRLRRFKLKLLAEKVETREEFEKALKMGFSYFQGYFFSKPENIRIQELEASKINMLHLLAEVTRKSTTLGRLHQIISKDVSISYKLLRFLNSAYFYLVQKVTTVRHAIAYLGQKELRRFIILVIISELASDQPDELVRLALVRAKFCELLGKATGLEEDADELYLVGLFSLIDVMLGTGMEGILDNLSLSEASKEALIGHTGPYAVFLDFVTNYERGRKKKLESGLPALAVDPGVIPHLYLKAVRYANALS